jgi:hypothetical protein
LTASDAIKGNPDTAQTGSRIAFGDLLVFTAQLTVEAAQLLALIGIQAIFEGFTEKGDAIVRTPSNRQAATPFAEEGTGAVEIGGWGIFPGKEISQQIGQGEMMPATAATGPIATGTGLAPSGLGKELIQSLLACGDRLKPLPEPRSLKLAERSKLSVDALQKSRPVRTMILILFSHGR